MLRQIATIPHGSDYDKSGVKSIIDYYNSLFQFRFVWGRSILFSVWLEFLLPIAYSNSEYQSDLGIGACENYRSITENATDEAFALWQKMKKMR